MSYRSQVATFVKKMGGTIENNSAGDEYLFNVDAPKGKTWDGDLHSFVVTCYKGDPKWLEEAWKDCLGRFDKELHDCTDPNCDFCNPPEE